MNFKANSNSVFYVYQTHVLRGIKEKKSILKEEYDLIFKIKSFVLTI